MTCPSRYGVLLDEGEFAARWKQLAQDEGHESKFPRKEGPKTANTFAVRLRQLIEEDGMSQIAAANALGISCGRVSYICREEGIGRQRPWVKLRDAEKCTE